LSRREGRCGIEFILKKRILCYITDETGHYESSAKK